MAVTRISSTEANRNFSKLLARVRKGETAEIMVRGQVVARIEPVSDRDTASELEKQKRWDAFIERLRGQPMLGVPRGTRNELYDDE